MFWLPRITFYLIPPEGLSARKSQRIDRKILNLLAIITIHLNFKLHLVFKLMVTKVFLFFASVINHSCISVDVIAKKKQLRAENN